MAALKALGVLALGLKELFLDAGNIGMVVPACTEKMVHKNTQIATLSHHTLDILNTYVYDVKALWPIWEKVLAHKLPTVRTQALKWANRCLLNEKNAMDQKLATSVVGIIFK